MAEQLAWLEGLGFDGIELSAAALDLPPRELEEIFADSPIRAANIAGSGALLDPDPAERAAAKELMRRRLDLAATLGAVGLLTVPQFGSAPCLTDLSPYKSGAELESELFVEQLQELAPATRDAGVPIFLGFAALKEAGYDGHLGIECRISGPYDEALAESAALLRDLWDAA